MTDGATLDALARLGQEASIGWIAAETHALAERLAEGRFYVVCVGQFKWGKSTLLNALIGTSVLPTGVVPITAAVTVVRHGAHLAACVRFRDRDWEECDPTALAIYVSEEHNPANEKAVTAVEVFVPSPLLHSGMCLVDTPGLGSVSLANTEATRAFVPHIDAALVVLGADPPITGEELALVEEVARTAGDMIVVFNKADRQSETERAEAIRFTRRVLEEKLGRPVTPVLQVSAAERLERGSTRDWEQLVTRLERLALDSGAELVAAAQARETRALLDALLQDLDEQRRALLEPVADSEARAALLREAVADGERALVDLGHLLTGEQERLARRFTEERDRFFAGARSAAEQELRQAVRRAPAPDRDARTRALECALDVTTRWLERWRQEQEPRAEALYREAERPLVELAREFQERLVAVPGLEGLPRLEPHEGLREKSRFQFTEMLRVAPTSASGRALDVLLPWHREQVVERDAVDYLARLLEVNSARLKNDFVERVVQSRRLLEREIRDRLQRLVTSAERAFEHAREAHIAGTAAVRARLDRIESVRRRAERVNRAVTTPAETATHPPP